MAILRTRSRLIGAAPPPSPIATGKGLRSAAVDDQILAEYLEKTLQVPDLVLPESQFSARVDRAIPDEIEFESLGARDGDSIRRVLESVAEFGLFRIVGQGISADELESALAGTDCVFQISEEKRSDFDGVFGSKMSNREQFFWFRSREATVKILKREIGSDRYQKLSEKMESIFGKLEDVAEIIVQILSENPGETIDGLGESVLRLCRYNCDSIDQGTTTHSAFDDGQGEENLGAFDHGLSLYLFDCDHDFHIRTHEKGLLSFKARRGTIIVAIKKLFEAWSCRGFSRVVKEPVFFEPNNGGGRHYSIEFMCSLRSPNIEHNHIIKKISLTDQIFIVAVVAIVYSFLKFLVSRFLKTQG